MKAAWLESLWEGRSPRVSWRDAAEEGKRRFQILGVIARGSDHRTDHSPFPGIIGAGADDRHAGLQRNLVKAGLPIGSPGPRPLRSNDQGEILMRFELGNDLANQVLRRAAVDGNAAKCPHETTHWPFEQAVLADEAHLAAKRMFDLVDTPAEVVDAVNAPELLVTDGHVRFEEVAFGYEPERIILKGVTLDVPAGTSLAVVGPSGAGKSTLARLLYRFYDPTAGRITIDGQDISQVRQSTLRAAIGIVPQDTVLFNDTIGYNIGYGREGAGEADVEKAARGAAIDHFIAALPQGYESMVGERGLKLSGGEKQRVAIARTLLKDPPILILDEATSALDSRTEEAIQSTLDNVVRNRTTIVIAHRLSTVVGADQIVVLDAGRVAERGTHAELLAKGGLYSELWARQAAERELEEVVAEA